jgi:hypothetical protein
MANTVSIEKLKEASLVHWHLNGINRGTTLTSVCLCAKPLAVVCIEFHENTSTTIRNTNGMAKIEAQAISSPKIVRACLML